MTSDAEQSSRRSAPASFGLPGRVSGASHPGLAASFFDAAHTVRADVAPVDLPARRTRHVTLHSPVSHSMVLGTVTATVCAIAAAVATFGA